MYSERAVIAVLGPTRPSGATAEAIEQQGTALGASLAQAGYGVATLGDGLTASACLQGARQQSGLGIAVHHHPESVAPPGVTVETREGLLAGFERLLEVADAVMVLPGDVRALALLSLIWSWGSEPKAPFRQVLLVGERWPQIVRALADAAELDQKTRAMVTFAPSVTEAVDALRYYVAPR